MLTIPLYFLLIIYAAFLLVFFIFIITNILHLAFTGSATFISFLITLVVLALTVIIIFSTYVALRDVNWFSALTIFDKNWFSPNIITGI